MNAPMNKNGFSIFLASILTFICLIFPLQSRGEEPSRIKLDGTSPQRLELTVGKSVIIAAPAPVRQVSLASPEIADALVISPQQVYLTGKAPGTTTVTVWETEDKVSAVVLLEVSPDISRFKEALYKILPEEKEVQVTATHESITLSGNVSSATSLSQVLAMAEAYFPKKVINVLQVSGVHQVMLEVRVSEMSRSLLKRLGFNFNYIGSNGQNIGMSMLNNLTKLPQAGFPASGVEVSDKITGIFRFLKGGVSWTAFIDALKEEGLIKVLAEPTLITLSGKNASFLAGGEFPIPIPQSSGAGFIVTITYKPFGVGLNFTPTVLSGNRINLQVAPEVSELDFSQAVTISGFVVPSLTTRRVSTNIELADGQSFAIAGLLKSDVREIVSKFPVLGDIPILGALFRSTSFQKNETELIIIVTPHLVKPIDMSKQTLPTDQFIEPNDFDFYLMGKLEGEDKGKPANPQPAPSSGLPRDMGLEGKFGHITDK
ncbi:MAG: type II and III secretion system protein family protein [Deltaproteobacteria bacterium]|nr:type II and III secretion system protein family protein [Deltaproteobacteria bacterium]